MRYYFPEQISARSKKPTRKNNHPENHASTLVGARLSDTPRMKKNHSRHLHRACWHRLCLVGLANHIQNRNRQPWNSSVTTLPPEAWL
jgi:hypothetical protein